MSSGSTIRTCMAAAGAIIVVTCGGGSSTTPTSPVVAIPPTTTLAAAPPPVASSSACARIGMGPGDGNACPRESATFLTELNDAIDLTVRQYPRAFDQENINGAGQYAVLSSGQFYVGLVQNLNAKGLCAGFDGEEIWIKSSNDFNDQYQVLPSNGHIRRGESSYRATCYPAAFPKPDAPLPPTVAGFSAPSRPRSTTPSRRARSSSSRIASWTCRHITRVS
jgi:hypothetical protein